MQKFYRLSVNIVKILTLLLAVFLFIGSFLTTCYAENMETQQVLLRFDNPLWNLLELAGYGLLFACCLSLSGKTGVKFRRGLLVFTLGLILLLGGMLIVFGRTVPAADALSVYNAAAEWILGNKDIIHPTFSYLSYYPQQIGLMAFLELLLRLWNLTGLSAPAWHFVKLVYVCLLCVAVLFQYRSLRYLWPDDWEPVSCCYLILVCCNLPMILYSSFVYGEIPSFAMLSVGLFLLLKLLADCIPAHSVETTSPDDTRVVGTSHALSAVTVFTALGSILFLTLSVMLRKNSLILIIAVLLVLFFACGLNYTMLLGGVWGNLVCAGNFFLMGKSAEKSLRRGSGKSAQSYMNTMYCLRYLGLFLAMTAAAFVPFIDLICAAVPLFFPKIIITLRGLWENRTRRSNDTGRQ